MEAANPQPAYHLKPAGTILIEELSRKLTQWKPLDVITLGQRESDNINQMITISDCHLLQNSSSLIIWDSVNLGLFDHINRMLTLLVITLCSYKSATIALLPTKLPLFKILVSWTIFWSIFLPTFEKGWQNLEEMSDD